MEALTFTEYADFLLRQSTPTESTLCQTRIQQYRKQLFEQLSDTLEEFQTTSDPAILSIQIAKIQDLLSAVQTLSTHAPSH